MRHHLGDKYNVHTLSFLDSNPLHIDCTFVIIGPGLAVVNPERPCKQADMFHKAGWKVDYCRIENVMHADIICGVSMKIQQQLNIKTWKPYHSAHPSKRYGSKMSIYFLLLLQPYLNHHHPCVLPSHSPTAKYVLSALAQLL